MDKEAFRQLLLEVLPTVVNETFGLDVEGIKQQFAIVNSASANAAQARLSTLLDLRGEDLVKASGTLMDYYEKLAPHEREAYNDDAAVLSLWQSLQAPADGVPAADTSGSPKSGKLKQSDIDAMPMDEFRRREKEIEAAYLNGEVEDDEAE